MDFTNKIAVRIALFLILATLVGSLSVHGQETKTEVATSGAYHNQVFFNRFLINPTFSLVRENKSYLNILHRNQYATFDDNSQNYFLGFSNKLNNHTALGIGVYSQSSGVIQEFGFNANYATSVSLSANSKLAFGTNITYVNKGVDKNRVVISEQDPTISDARKESEISIQPGINLSLGNFDFGLYAEDLFRYNQTTEEFITNLSLNSVKASVQYTHEFKAGRGLFHNARLMPLAQVGQNLDGSLYYLGSLVLDLPSYGWLQTTVDQEYGMSAGVGFNLSKTMSLGYLMEKDLSQQEANLGWNHELSLAYTFKDDNSMANSYVDSSNDAKIDRIVRNYEEQISDLLAEKNKEQKKAKFNEKMAKGTIDENTLAYQNKLILDELMIRQDSIEASRIASFEERFETIVRLLRNDIKDNIKSSLQDFSTETKSDLASTNVADEKENKYLDFTTSEYSELPVKVLGDADAIGVKSGYYVIANVYKNKKYLNAFVESLEKKGLEPKQFYNKENGLHYVYLADYDAKQQAQSASISNLGGKYNDEKWIMQVDRSTATASNVYEDDEAYYSREE
ncbi:MAG: type IX secretion system PorP/SprF family membrane protein [Maribacter sp.]|jgi:type IX secretion system PorP/SprF family membrane protein